MALLYRGVPEHTQRGIEAKQGMVRPRGDSKDYEAHVRGEDVDADVTSWTRSSKVAAKFGNIILTVEEETIRDQIVDNPLSNRYPNEQEVLIRGNLDGLTWTYSKK